jgi:hypothetical protein
MDLRLMSRGNWGNAAGTLLDLADAALWDGRNAGIVGD